MEFRATRNEDGTFTVTDGVRIYTAENQSEAFKILESLVEANDKEN